MIFNVLIFLRSLFFYILDLLNIKPYSYETSTFYNCGAAFYFCSSIFV